MTRHPEQDIVNYLHISGYSPDTIISYLELLANKGRYEFAEGDYFDFTVCERPDGTRYGTDEACNPETGRPVSPANSRTASPSGKPDKTLDELRMEKMRDSAKKQGSSPANNRKVVIDGKQYGWAKKDGKWIIVPWGSVGGVKKVGPKRPTARRRPAERARGQETPRSPFRSGGTVT